MKKNLPFHRAVIHKQDALPLPANVNGQIKERTKVVGLFPNEESLLRLVTGVLIEISETWETTKAYLKLS